MSSKKDNILKALKLAIEFIDKLDDNQLEGLVSNNMIFDIKLKDKEVVEKKEEIVIRNVQANSK